ATLGGLLTVLAPASAAYACVDGPAIVIGGALALLTPGDIGVALPAADAASPGLVLGWSWQIPLSSEGLDAPAHHRLVPSVDLLPHSGGASWRGRLGYRYGRRHLLAGAGVGIDGAGVNLSPEIGVKFLHADKESGDGIDFSMHLLGRAEI